MDQPQQGFPLLNLPTELIVQIISNIEDVPTVCTILHSRELCERISQYVTIVTNHGDRSQGFPVYPEFTIFHIHQIRRPLSPYRIYLFDILLSRRFQHGLQDILGDGRYVGHESEIDGAKRRLLHGYPRECSTNYAIADIGHMVDLCYGPTSFISIRFRPGDESMAQKVWESPTQTHLIMMLQDQRRTGIHFETLSLGHEIFIGERILYIDCDYIGGPPRLSTQSNVSVGTLRPSAHL